MSEVRSEPFHFGSQGGGCCCGWEEGVGTPSLPLPLRPHRGSAVRWARSEHVEPRRIQFPRVEPVRWGTERCVGTWACVPVGLPCPVRTRRSCTGDSDAVRVIHRVVQRLRTFGWLRGPLNRRGCCLLWGARVEVLWRVRFMGRPGHWSRPKRGVLRASQKPAAFDAPAGRPTANSRCRGCGSAATRGMLSPVHGWVRRRHEVG